MSAVVKTQDGVMKPLAAGLVVLTALALSGCSRDSFERSITRFRDRVVADAATAEARRSLQPRQLDYDGGYGYYRAPLRQEAPKTPGADDKTNPDGTPATPTDPNAPPKPFSGQASAPPTVYYYSVAPSAAPAR
jgi:hypothetical protein